MSVFTIMFLEENINKSFLDMQLPALPQIPAVRVSLNPQAVTQNNSLSLTKRIYISLTLIDLCATGNHDMDNCKWIMKSSHKMNFQVNNGERKHICKIEITLIYWYFLIQLNTVLQFSKQSAISMSIYCMLSSTTLHLSCKKRSFTQNSWANSQFISHLDL